MEWVPRAGPSNRINVPRGCQNVTAAHACVALDSPWPRGYPRRVPLRFADRARAIQPFLAMEVMERAFAMERAGARVIHLEIGEPDFPPPPAAVLACTRALREGETRYTDSRGLRRAARGDRAGARASRGRARRSGARARHERHLAGDAARVLVARRAGRRGDPRHAALSLLSELRARLRRNSRADSDRGRGRLSDRRRGGAARARTAHARDRRELARESDRRDPERRDAGRARGARAFRSSPTRSTTGSSTTARRTCSALSLGTDVFVLDGFSKRYAMTGFRLGYVIAPERALRPLQAMQQSFFISASRFVQHAGLAALREGGATVEAMCAAYAQASHAAGRGAARARSARSRGAARRPSTCSPMRATSARTRCAWRCCCSSARRSGTAPGIDFGAAGEGWLRFCCAASESAIAEALARLAGVLPSLR